MHELQKHILAELVTHPTRRYRELKPGEAEGNLFTYHLNKLVQTGLIERVPGGYSLSARGERYVNKLRFPDLKPRVQPKIAILIAVQSSTGEWLLYHRKRQPLIGRIGFPYAFANRGETVSRAAHREFKSVTGLSTKLVHRGDVYLTTYKDKELLAEVFCHVFAGKVTAGKLKTDSVIGKLFWSSGEGFRQSELLPGFSEIKRLLTHRRAGRFFAELTFDTRKQK